jgi:hypothetical protein
VTASRAAQRLMTGSLHGETDGVRASQQRLFEITARRRQERTTAAETVGVEPSRTMAKAVSAVISVLPATGAVAMEWPDVLKLAHLDEPSSERLLELQSQLKKARVLAAFGSRVVVFARDPE